jgi:hypothetical protein
LRQEYGRLRRFARRHFERSEANQPSGEHGPIARARPFVQAMRISASGAAGLLGFARNDGKRQWVDGASEHGRKRS